MKLHLIVLACIVFSRCKLIEHLPDEKRTLLTKENYQILNGTYSDFPDTVAGHYSSSRDGVLTLMSNVDRTYIDDRGGTSSEEIELKFINENELRVKVQRSGEMKYQMTIPGKLKDGYFYRNSHFIVIPFFPVFVLYSQQKFRIGLSQNSLVIDNRTNWFGWVLIAGGSKKVKASSKFRQIAP